MTSTSSTQAQPALPLLPTVRESEANSRHPAALRSVGAGLRGSLTDEELEDHIQSLGKLLLAAYGRYEQTSCFSDLGEAHRWELMQREAILSRRPAKVLAMERERGLA